MLQIIGGSRVRGTTVTSDWIAGFEQSGVTLQAGLVGTSSNRSVTVQGAGAAIYHGMDTTNNVEFLMGVSGFQSAVVGSMTNHPLHFRTNNTLISQFTIDGNLLIGTSTNNGKKLQVNGQIYANNNITIAGGSLTMLITSGGNYQLYVPGSNNFTLYNSNVGNIGSFNYTTGVYTALSDINKKKDFELSTLGLDAILGLKSTLYRMNADKDDCEKHLGFIAQEVKEYIPQAYVQTEEFIGLDYQAITATLVKAIQEMNTKIIQLEKLVATK